MGLSSQLRSVIQWENPDPEILFLRWTEDGDEIKNASKLIVGPGQGCVFVYEGKVEAVFTEPGVVELSTENIPFWTTIKNVLQKFESHHKVGLYFFRTADMVNRRWGTPSPITYDDPKYNFPVGLGAFGNYSMRITKAQEFFVNVVAATSPYTVKELQRIILSRITQPMTDFLAKAKFSYAEIDANRSDIAAAVTKAVAPIFYDLGFELVDFRIEGTNFDEATQGRIGKIADMTAEAMAAKAAGIDYAQHQQLMAIRDAAKNEGVGGIGLQMGIGQQLGQMIAPQPATQASAQAAPVPAAPATDDATAKLTKLKSLLDAGLIDDDEYKAKKAEILKDLL